MINKADNGGITRKNGRLGSIKKRPAIDPGKYDTGTESLRG